MKTTKEARGQIDGSTRPGYFALRLCTVSEASYSVGCFCSYLFLEMSVAHIKTQHLFIHGTDGWGHDSLQSTITTNDFDALFEDESDMAAFILFYSKVTHFKFSATSEFLLSEELCFLADNREKSLLLLWLGSDPTGSEEKLIHANKKIRMHEEYTWFSPHLHFMQFSNERTNLKILIHYSLCSKN